MGSSTLTSGRDRGASGPVGRAILDVREWDASSVGSTPIANAALKVAGAVKVAPANVGNCIARSEEACDTLAMADVI